METTAIRITCAGSDTADLESLAHFQNDLKTLTTAQGEKIKNSMIKYGFSFPVFVWNSPKGMKIIDGHQRVFVLKKMLSEGFTLEGGKVPIAIIEAKDAKEAKEKVLLAASRYGRIDEGGLFDFLKEADLDLEDMKLSIDLPDLYLDLDNFEAGKFDPNAEWKGMPEFETEDRSFRSIVVHMATEADFKDFCSKVKQEIGENSKYIWYPVKKQNNLKDKVWKDSDGEQPQS